MAEGTAAPVAGSAGPLLAAYVVERALRRSRWKTFFRFLLVIPHVVVLSVLALGIVPVWLVGFVAALVLGRLPGWVRAYLGGVGAWWTRLTTYYSLLTDAYPPFRFTAPDHPVQVTLPPATPLRRWAVLLRIPLIPVAYVAFGLVGGIFVFTIFAWFAGVLAGRTPRAVFDAIATVQRYQWRIFAYMGLLVPTFPWGAFGDGPALPTAPAGYPPAGWGYPPYGYPPPPPGYGYPPPPGYGYPPPPPAAPAPPPEARRRPSPYPTPPPPVAPPPSLPSYPPPPQAFPAAAPPGGSTRAYAPMPPPPATAGPTGERREPWWYDGLVSAGGKAILIIMVVIGGLQLLVNGVQVAHGGGSLAVLHLGTTIKIELAVVDLVSDERSCEDGSCPDGVLQTDADRLRARVEGAPSRGGHRDQVLHDLDRLDADLATSDPSDPVPSAAVARDVHTVETDVAAYVRALAG